MNTRVGDIEKWVEEVVEERVNKALQPHVEAMQKKDRWILGLQEELHKSNRALDRCERVNAMLRKKVWDAEP